jgi:hypothetical protein
VWISFNYNNIYIAGSSASVGFYGSTPCADLAAWRAASGQDANSINKPVNFVSATDLHVTGSSIGDKRFSLSSSPLGCQPTLMAMRDPMSPIWVRMKERQLYRLLALRTVSSGLPTEFSLWQNYPNPFNPTTVIAFALPKSTQVTLMVYNMLGQPVAVLQNGFLKAGYYHVNFDASNLPSGTYIYRIQAGDYRNVKKMTIVK